MPSLRHRMISRPRAGIGLVEVLIAVGVLGIMVVGVATGLANSGKAARSAQIHNEFEEVRRYLRGYLSCANTLYDASGNSLCTSPPGYLAGIGNDSSQLIAPSSSGSVLADHYHVRISCYPGVTDRLLIEAARYDLAGQNVTKDPLNGSQFTWKDLFNGIPVECAPSDPCTPTPSGGMIDFETLPDGTKPVAGMNISDQYWNTAGVSFQFDNGSPARLVKINDTATAIWSCFSDPRWPPVPANYPPCSINALKANGIRGNQGVGNFLIGPQVADAFEPSPPALIVTYRTPVKQAGMALLDIDDYEHWDITAFDASGNQVAAISVEAAPTHPGYWRDGMATYVVIPPTPLATATIASINLKGHNPMNFPMGLGLDNFTPSGFCSNYLNTFGESSATPWLP